MADITGSYVDLYEKYWGDIEKLWTDKQGIEHCKEYEELTMEEKLLVNIDMEYLKDETDMRYLSSLSWQTLEKCLSKLRKRDRKNDKRHRK